jgi:hypothetical protein
VVTDDPSDAAGSLRSLVEGEKERLANEARLGRERLAQQEAQARERADRIRLNREHVSVFLGAMRRAGNPGVEEVRLEGAMGRPWWKLGFGYEQYIPGPPIAGWTLHEGEPEMDRRGSSAGLFLSTEGDLYFLDRDGRGGRLTTLGFTRDDVWAWLRGQELARIMVVHGVGEFGPSKPPST